MVWSVIEKHGTSASCCRLCLIFQSLLLVFERCANKFESSHAQTKAKYLSIIAYISGRRITPLLPTTTHFTHFQIINPYPHSYPNHNMLDSGLSTVIAFIVPISVIGIACLAYAMYKKRTRVAPMLPTNDNIPATGTGAGTTGTWATRAGKSAVRRDDGLEVHGMGRGSAAV
jgi:hypothetical protein